MPKLRQYGSRSSSRSRLDSAAAPNHNGGGESKISVRGWVANTKVKYSGASSTSAPAPTSSSAVRRGRLSMRCALAAAIVASSALEQLAVAPGQPRDDHEQDPRHRRGG